MSGEINRKIVIDLKLNADPQSAAEAAKVERSVADLYAETMNQWIKTQKERTKIVAAESANRIKILESEQKFYEDLKTRATPTAVARAQSPKWVQPEVKSTDQTETSPRGTSLPSAGQRAVEQLDKLRERTLLNHEKERLRELNKGQSAVQQLDKQRERSLLAVEREREREQKLAQKSVLQAEKQREREAQAAIKERQQEEAKGVRALRQLDAQRSRALLAHKKGQERTQATGLLALQREKKQQAARGQKAVGQLDSQRSRAFLASEREAERERKREEAAGLKAIQQLDAQRSRALLAVEREKERDNKRNELAGQKAVRQLDAQKSKALLAEDREAEHEKKRQLMDFEKLQQQVEVSAVRSAKAQKEALTAVGGAMLGVTDGILQMTKGYAYLGLVGEKDAKKILDTLVLVEGSISTLRGGVAIFRSIQDGVEGVRAAMLATATAADLLGKSQLAISAVGSVGGTAGGVAGSVAGGVAGGVARSAAAKAGGSAVGSTLGSVAGGAAGGVLPYLSRFLPSLGGGAGGATGTLGRLMPTLSRFLPSAAGVSRMMPMLTAGAQFAGAAATGVYLGDRLSSRFSSDGKGTIGTGIEAASTYLNARREGRRLDAMSTQLEERRERTAQQNQRIEQSASHRAAQRSQRDASSLRNDELSVSGDFLTPQYLKDLQLISQERIRAEKEVDDAKKEAATAEENRLNRQQSHQAELHSEKLVAVQREKDAAERMVQVNEKYLSVLRDQVLTRKQHVQTRESQAVSAKDNYDAEVRNTESKSAAFGRLSPGEQKWLEAMAEKNRTGADFNRGEIERLDSTGFGKDIVQDFYRRRGEDAGSKETLAKLGDRDDEAEAHALMDAADSRLAQEQVALTSATGEHEAAIKKTTESLEELQQKVNALGEVISRINDLIPAAESGEPQAEDGRAVSFNLGSGVNQMGSAVSDAMASQAEAIRTQAERSAASSWGIA